MNYNYFVKIDSLPALYRLGFLLILFAFVINMAFPQSVLAESAFAKSNGQIELVMQSLYGNDLLTQKYFEYEQKQEELRTKSPIKTTTVVATAYSSTPDQTDSTPCIAADGFNVCANGQENIIAANFLPFGTKVRVPDQFGDQIFTVHDRMNPRFNHRIDFWKTSRNRALSFGKRLVEIEIVEYGNKK